MDHTRKERKMKGHLISEILKHAQSDNMVGRLLNDEGTADESAIRRYNLKVKDFADYKAQF